MRFPRHCAAPPRFRLSKRLEAVQNGIRKWYSADALGSVRQVLNDAGELVDSLRLAGAPGNVLLTARESGLPNDLVINVSQIITSDKRCLTVLAGQVDQRVMSRVEDGIRLVLDL